MTYKKLFWVGVFSYLWIASIAMAQDEAEQLVLWARHDLANESSAVSVAMREHITRFEDETGIEIIYEQVAWDQLAPKLAIAVQSGGNVPDVVEVWSQHIPTLLDVGALMPLDALLADETWITELDMRDFESCIIPGMSGEEMRFCVAYDVRGGVTYYRTEAFPEDFPQTSEAWLSAARNLSGYDYFSTQFVGRSYAAIETGWWPLIASNQGDIFDSEGKPAWATEEVAEVVTFLREMYENEYLPELNISGTFSDAEAPWISGDAASFRGASWSSLFVPGLRDAVDSGDVAIAGGVQFGDESPHVFLVSQSWVIPEDAANTEVARLWMRHFMQPEFLSEWVSLQNGIPTLPSARTDEYFNTPFFQQISEIFDTQGIYMQRSPYYLESLDSLSVAFQELLLDTEMNIIDRLQQAEDEVLRRYW